MQTRIVAAVCGLILLVGGQAGATGEPDLTPVGADRLISTSANEEVQPKVAWNKTDNQYLVVWEDRRNLATRGREIFGRRVGADGVPIGANFRISTSTADERYAVVVWNETANEYLVVWQDHRAFATRSTEIYGRRVSATGTLLGADFRISSSPLGEWVPQVAWNATANQYLVVWLDYRNQASRGIEIYGRRVAGNGVPIGTSDTRISRATTDEYYPQVAWNATANEYLVVWDDYRNQATRGSEIFGRRVGANGVPIGTADRRLSSSSANEFSAAVAWSSAANEYLVVWVDERALATNGRENFGRRVGANGVPIGTTDTRIGAINSDEVNGFLLRPAVVWNAIANQYLVVWADGRNSATRGEDLYGRRVALNGIPVGGSVRVSGPNAIADDVFPAVAWNATANQYLVVWQDHRSEATRGREIYGRRLAGDPAP